MMCSVPPFGGVLRIIVIPPITITINRNDKTPTQLARLRSGWGLYCRSKPLRGDKRTRRLVKTRGTDIFAPPRVRLAHFVVESLECPVCSQLLRGDFSSIRRILAAVDAAMAYVLFLYVEPAGPQGEALTELNRVSEKVRIIRLLKHTIEKSFQCVGLTF